MEAAVVSCTSFWQSPKNVLPDFYWAVGVTYYSTKKSLKMVEWWVVPSAQCVYLIYLLHRCFSRSLILMTVDAVACRVSNTACAISVGSQNNYFQLYHIAAHPSAVLSVLPARLIVPYLHVSPIASIRGAVAGISPPRRISSYIT